MKRISAHEFSEHATICLHCGARKTVAERSPELSCISRNVAEDRTRVSALDDIDTIYARILEIRAEEARTLAGKPAEPEYALSDF